MGAAARRFFFGFAALATIFVLSGCADPKEAAISQACVKSTANTADATVTRCNCLATSARKYLSPHDYDLLAGVAYIYVSDEPREVKSRKMIDGLVASGLTFPQAIATTMNLMLAAEHADRDCTSSPSSATS
jgi:hypothetical protein